VALAAVLTVLVRRGLRAAPLIAFDAPKMGSGKTLVATVCSYVAVALRPVWFLGIVLFVAASIGIVLVAW
jgi:hypothetical protein